MLELDMTHLVVVSTTALSQLMQHSALLMTQLIQKQVLMQLTYSLVLTTKLVQEH